GLRRRGQWCELASHAERTAVVVRRLLEQDPRGERQPLLPARVLPRAVLGFQPPLCHVLIASTGHTSISALNKKLSRIQPRRTISVRANSAAERHSPRRKASTTPRPQ